MPDGLVGAGAAIAGNLMNNLFAAGQNKKQRSFIRQMYERQRNDAYTAWSLENAYNTPAAQMQRFKDAGLNPALIYGQTNMAGGMSTPGAQSYTPSPVRPGDAVPAALDAIMLTTDLEMKRAQIDNVRAQNEVIREQAVLLGSQVAGTEASTREKILRYNLNNILFETDVDARKEGLRKLRNDIDIATRRDFREAVQQSSNLKEAAERIKRSVQSRAQMKQQMAQSRDEQIRIRTDTQRIVTQIDNMKKEGQLKDLDVWLSKQAIRPGDPTWYRVVASLFDTLIRSDVKEADIFQKLLQFHPTFGNR